MSLSSNGTHLSNYGLVTWKARLETSFYDFCDNARLGTERDGFVVLYDTASGKEAMEDRTVMKGEPLVKLSKRFEHMSRSIFSRASAQQLAQDIGVISSVNGLVISKENLHDLGVSEEELRDPKNGEENLRWVVQQMFDLVGFAPKITPYPSPGAGMHDPPTVAYSGQFSGINKSAQNFVAGQYVYVDAPGRHETPVFYQGGKSCNDSKRTFVTRPWRGDAIVHTAKRLRTALKTDSVEDLKNDTEPEQIKRPDIVARAYREYTIAKRVVEKLPAGATAADFDALWKSEHEPARVRSADKLATMTDLPLSIGANARQKLKRTFDNMVSAQNQALLADKKWVAAVTTRSCPSGHILDMNLVKG